MLSVISRINTEAFADQIQGTSGLESAIPIHRFAAEEAHTRESAQQKDQSDGDLGCPSAFDLQPETLPLHSEM